MDQNGAVGQLKRLSPRQIECLALVAQNHSSKEIARLLNLSVNTVNSYISEGVELLGSSNRREAARLIMALQQGADTPDLIGSESLRVTAADLMFNKPESGMPLSEYSIIEAKHDEKNGFDFPSDALLGFHLFRGDRSHNTLSTLGRLLWIMFVSVGLAVLLSISLTVIDTITRLTNN